MGSSDHSSVLHFPTKMGQNSSRHSSPSRSRLKEPPWIEKAIRRDIEDFSNSGLMSRGEYICVSLAAFGFLNSFDRTKDDSFLKLCEILRSQLHTLLMERKDEAFMQKIRQTSDFHLLRMKLDALMTLEMSAIEHPLTTDDEASKILQEILPSPPADL